MSTFIGRKQELETLGSLLKKRSASLIVIKGRRRIGKSRLVEEFARQHAFDHVFVFSGVFPTRKTTLQSQLNEFSSQLHTQTGLPEVQADDWNKLFLLLAEKTKVGKTLVLLDEISWMGSKDPDFLGKFKNAWDLHFKKNDQLIIILCGSISTWIEKNILSSTGFVGRISMDLSLKELPLYDCAKFWGKQAEKVSAHEKFKILSVTGGIPLYLEHMNPHLSAEENIKQLCFSPHGILFNEFDKIFSDLFSKRSAKYKKIVECLSSKPATQEEICKAIHIKHSSDIHEYLEDLAQSGFITKAHTWRIKEGLPSNLRQYRLSDNYSRFYLKYIYPNRVKVENNQFTQAAIARLSNWDTIMGLQFENLVLNNRPLLWDLLKIQPEEIICDNPYFQRKTERIHGCQIDYLIQTKYNTLYVCEIKFSKNTLGKEIITEVTHKINAMTIPKHFSYRPVLIHVNGVSNEIKESDFFSAIVDFGQLLLDT